MWIVTLNDNSVDEQIDIVAMSLEEVKDIIVYAIDSKGILDLEHIEQRWMVFGLQGLKDMTENDIPDKV